MKNIKALLPAFILLLSSLAASAQPLNEKERNYLSEHNVQLIDSTALFKDVLQNNGKVKMLVIFTNYCVGTPYMFENIGTFNKAYGDKIEYVLCSSAPTKELDDLVKVLDAHRYTDKIYFIDPEFYKEYSSDDRKKGLLFRNAICPPCRNAVIGTPYYIFFDTNQNILFHGYNSRNDFNAMLSDYFKQQ